MYFCDNVDRSDTYTLCVTSRLPALTYDSRHSEQLRTLFFTAQTTVLHLIQPGTLVSRNCYFSE